MHPAYSVILFTTASGAGYGLMALLAALASLGIIPPESWLGFFGFAIAFGLVTLGLLSSTFHLGHPERSWRALSQWRSSWLSREGVMAVWTYIPSGLFAIGWVFYETIWPALGWITVISVIITVYCTAMIYGSLKTIRQWHNPWVPAVYLSLGFATGALLLNVLLRLYGVVEPAAAWLAIAGLILAFVVKLAYWGSIAGGRRKYTIESATGLGRFGKVRQIEAPHSRANFVMREMGYQVARSHAYRLKLLVVLLLFVVPLVLTLPSLGEVGPFVALAALVAAGSAALGVLVERWLFFAEAEHVVTVFYGAEAA